MRKLIWLVMIATLAYAGYWFFGARKIEEGAQAMIVQARSEGWGDAQSVSLAGFAAQIGAPVTQDVRDRIDTGVRRAAYTIIAGKGATWYGIGAGLARIVAAIAGDGQAVLSVSMLEDDVLGIGPVALSLPRVVGAGGVSATLWPDLDAAETEALRASAGILRAQLDRLTL